MDKRLFEPLADRLICIPVEHAEVSKGGIMMPEMDEQRTIRATVAYSGLGFWAAADLFVPNTCKPGDVVTYQRFAAQTMEHDGVEYHIVQERDVLTKVNL